ncbi:MAG TPA: class I SAM-dependent methyltransferase [Terracidiphilus sp.]|nr:class I SAM-dependent methyltransferase [Terracidiphilus sp.]
MNRRRLPGLSRETGFTEHPFDKEFGVHTSGLIAGRHLKSGHKHDRHATAYFGVAPSVFHALIQRWQRTGPIAPIGEFTFIDIGAGMGRAMLLASELPFRSVLGIELNPVLLRTARKNLAHWRKSGRAVAPMRLRSGDAAAFRFPDGPCLAFLFNPFGAPVMKSFVRNIAATFANRPGQLDLLYVNYEQEHTIAVQRGMQRLFLGSVKRSRSDTRADQLIMTNQPDGEYTSGDYEDCSIWRWLGTRA